MNNFPKDLVTPEQAWWIHQNGYILDACFCALQNNKYHTIGELAYCGPGIKHYNNTDIPQVRYPNFNTVCEFLFELGIYVNVYFDKDENEWGFTADKSTEKYESQYFSEKLYPSYNMAMSAAIDYVFKNISKIINITLFYEF